MLTFTTYFGNARIWKVNFLIFILYFKIESRFQEWKVFKSFVESLFLVILTRKWEIRTILRLKSLGIAVEYKTFRSFRKEDYKSLDDRTFRRTQLFPTDFVFFFFLPFLFQSLSIYDILLKEKRSNFSRSIYHASISRIKDVKKKKKKKHVKTRTNYYWFAYLQEKRIGEYLYSHWGRNEEKVNAERDRFNNLWNTRGT